MAGHGRTTLLLAALLGSLLVAPAARAAPPVFEPAAAAIATGAGPVAAIADMNGDGRQDLVVAGDDRQITVRIARADGGFSTLGPFQVWGFSGIDRLQLVDIDGDGRRDIVAEGSPFYASLIATPAGDYTWSGVAHYGRNLTFADVDADGRLDIIQNHDGALDGLSVGTLQAGGGYVWTTVHTDEYVRAIATGDPTGDGRLDVVLVDDHEDLWILPGTPSGLGPAQREGFDVEASSLLVRDLNGDRHDDVAYVKSSANSVRVLFGDAHGHFGTEHWYAVPSSGRELIAGDLNGDGLQDLATVSDRLQVLPGASGGGFGPAQTVDLGPGAQSTALAVGDLDDDGRPDIVTAEASWPDWAVRERYNRTPLVSISAPALAGDTFDLSYTITGFLSAIDTLEIQVKRPDNREPYWLSRTFSAPSLSDTVTFRAWPEDGEVDYRLRAVVTGRNGKVLQTTPELVTHVTQPTTMRVDAPNFAGTAMVTTTATRRARITNTGAAPLVVRDVSVSDGVEFKLTGNDCKAPILTGGSCELEIAFSPAESGPRGGELVVRANAETQRIALAGTGTAAPARTLELLLPLPSRDLTPTPTPAPADPEPRLAFSSHPGAKTTRLIDFRLERLAPGTTVTVRCSRGCSRTTLTKRVANDRLSLASFVKRRLKAGTTIQITIAAPGKPVVVATLKIRARRSPGITTKLAAL